MQALSISEESGSRDKLDMKQQKDVFKIKGITETKFVTLEPC